MSQQKRTNYSILGRNLSTTTLTRTFQTLTFCRSNRRSRICNKSKCALKYAREEQDNSWPTVLYIAVAYNFHKNRFSQLTCLQIIHQHTHITWKFPLQLLPMPHFLELKTWATSMTNYWFHCRYHVRTNERLTHWLHSRKHGPIQLSAHIMHLGFCVRLDIWLSGRTSRRTSTVSPWTLKWTQIRAPSLPTPKNTLLPYAQLAQTRK